MTQVRISFTVPGEEEVSAEEEKEFIQESGGQVLKEGGGGR